MGIFGDMWVVPEFFSFLCRVCEIMGISCILMPDTDGSASFSELIFVLSCALVFFVNCFEFTGTARENLIVQLCGLGIGLLGTSVLLVNADPTELIYPAKFYASMFSGLGVTSCFISAADFYAHLTNQQMN